MKPDRALLAAFRADPTYIRAAIEARADWALAFRLSELDNDSAPIGWAAYIPAAAWLISHGPAAGDGDLRPALRAAQAAGVAPPPGGGR
jgi:hypothetical protein